MAVTVDIRVIARLVDEIQMDVIGAQEPIEFNDGVTIPLSEEKIMYYKGYDDALELIREQLDELSREKESHIPFHISLYAKPTKKPTPKVFNRFSEIDVVVEE